MIATLKSEAGAITRLNELDASQVIIEEAECRTDVVPQGGYAPRIFVEVDQDVLEGHIRPTICTVTVKCKEGKTAVVHLSLYCADGKVQGEITAGSLHRDVIKTVNVPVWNRKYVKGGAA